MRSELVFVAAAMARWSPDCDATSAILGADRPVANLMWRRFAPEARREPDQEIGCCREQQSDDSTIKILSSRCDLRLVNGKLALLQV